MSLYFSRKTPALNTATLLIIDLYQCLFLLLFTFHTVTIYKWNLIAIGEGIIIEHVWFNNEFSFVHHILRFRLSLKWRHSAIILACIVSAFADKYKEYFV